MPMDIANKKPGKYRNLFSNDVAIEKKIIPVHAYAALKLPRSIALTVGIATHTIRNDKIIGNLILPKRKQ
jgi:hypothetical protein